MVRSKRTGKLKLKPSLATAVNKLILRKQETKMCSAGSFYAAPFGNGTMTGVVFNSGIANTTEFYPLIPPIPQGTGESERIGDRVKPLGMTVRVLVAANGSYTSSQLNRCRLFIVQNKTIRNATLQSSLDPATLLDYGGYTAVYDGSPGAHGVPVNKEAWTPLHDRRITITKGTGRTPQLANTYTGDQVCVPTDQFHELVFKVKLPAHLMYEDEIATTPSNCAIWFALGYCQPDGQTTPDNILGRIQCNWISTVYYKDA